MKQDKTIILIGGSPTTGKTTVARALAKQLGLPWISTDQIGDMMQVTARRDDFPDIFKPQGYTAERFLTEFTAEEIVEKVLKHNEAVWLGIKAFIENDYEWPIWPEGFIVEGVHLLPRLIARDFGNNGHIKPVFLVDHDEDRLRRVVYERGLWGKAESYLDSVKEKEVEWVRLFGRCLETETKKYGYPWIRVSKHDNDIKAVLSVTSH